MDMHKTTQHLNNGDFNVFFSFMPPAIGRPLMVQIEAVKPKISETKKENNIFKELAVVGFDQSKVLLVGESQCTNIETIDHKEYIQYLSVSLDLSDENLNDIETMVLVGIEAAKKSLES